MEWLNTFFVVEAFCLIFYFAYIQTKTSSLREVSLKEIEIYIEKSFGLEMPLKVSKKDLFKSIKKYIKNQNKSIINLRNRIIILALLRIIMFYIFIPEDKIYMANINTFLCVIYIVTVLIYIIFKRSVFKNANTESFYKSNLYDYIIKEDYIDIKERKTNENSMSKLWS